MQNDIQLVINSIQDLEIKATYKNCSLIIGSINRLVAVRDRLEEEFPDDIHPVEPEEAPKEVPEEEEYHEPDEEAEG